MQNYFRASVKCLFLLAAWGTLSPAAAEPPVSQKSTFQVTGAVSSPRAWTAAQLQKELSADVQTIHYTLKGAVHTARAVSLWAVVQAEQPQINPQIKHHLLQFVASVQGRDGYTVDFTLGEISPDFGASAVWVAWDEDGHPLPEDDGPVELLVPGDKRAARWVHGVSAITLTDLAQSPERR